MKLIRNVRLTLPIVYIYLLYLYIVKINGKSQGIYSSNSSFHVSSLHNYFSMEMSLLESILFFSTNKDEIYYHGP